MGVLTDQKAHPLKRFGHPDEIAAAVLYLSSTYPPASPRSVVGTELVVDGGMIQLYAGVNAIQDIESVRHLSAVPTQLKGAGK